MDPHGVLSTIRWLRTVIGNQSIEIIFHGGESLHTGIEFYSEVLPLNKAEQEGIHVRFAIQSNL